jgi:acyl-coenzyme A thioesterase PaaI-like protein
MLPSDSALHGPILRASAHPRCVACSPCHPFGLKLDFRDAGGGAVRATFACNEAFEGYPGRLHGGIISTLLDAAMANCLFFRNLKGVTAELVVNFKAPVALNREATVEARVTRDIFPLFLMEAGLVQGGEPKASATAKFFVPEGM